MAFPHKFKEPVHHQTGKVNCQAETQKMLSSAWIFLWRHPVTIMEIFEWPQICINNCISKSDFWVLVKRSTILCLHRTKVLQNPIQDKSGQMVLSQVATKKDWIYKIGISIIFSMSIAFSEKFRQPYINKSPFAYLIGIQFFSEMTFRKTPTTF